MSAVARITHTERQEAAELVAQKAQESTKKELLKRTAGYQRQAEVVSPAAATPVAQQPAAKAPAVAAPQEQTRPASPMQDPAINPEAESELVKGATYQETKGQPFIQGEGDAHALAANDVRQGRLGDCYLMAALAALAHSSPDVLERMITDQGNGTYTVHFHEGGDVVVDNRFPMKDGAVQFAGVGDKSEEKGAELWVMLIQKAWAKLKGGYENIRGRNIRMQSTDAMQALGGAKSVALRPGSTPVDQIFDAIATAQQKGWAITVGMKNLSDPEAVKAARAAGVVPNHAYAVLGVDADNRTLELYNPWGAQHKVPPITLELLEKYASTVYINQS